MTAPDQNLPALLAPQPIYGGAYQSKGMKHCAEYKETKCNRCVRYDPGPKGGTPPPPKGKKGLDPREERDRRLTLIKDLGDRGKEDIEKELSNLGYSGGERYVSATAFDKAYKELTGVTPASVMRKLEGKEEKKSSKKKSEKKTTKKKSSLPKKSKNPGKDLSRRKILVKRLVDKYGEKEEGDIEQMINDLIMEMGFLDEDWEDVKTDIFDHMYKIVKDQLKDEHPKKKKVSFGKSEVKYFKKPKPPTRLEKMAAEIEEENKEFEMEPRAESSEEEKGSSRIKRKPASSGEESSETEYEEVEARKFGRLPPGVESEEYKIRRGLILALGPHAASAVNALLPKGVEWFTASPKAFMEAYRNVVEKRKQGEMKGKGLIGGEMIGGCKCCGSALLGGGPYGKAKGDFYPITTRTCSEYNVHKRSKGQKAATTQLEELTKAYNKAKKANAELTRAAFFAAQLPESKSHYVPKATRRAKAYEGYKTLIAARSRKGAALIGGAKYMGAGEYASCVAKKSIISHHPAHYEYKERSPAQIAASELLAARNERFKLAKQKNPDLTRAEFFAKLVPESEHRYINKATQLRRIDRRLKAITDSGIFIPEAA